jgi:hypothetical protein
VSQWKELGRKKKLKDLAKGSILQGVQGYVTKIGKKSDAKVMFESTNTTKPGF